MEVCTCFRVDLVMIGYAEMFAVINVVIFFGVFTVGMLFDSRVSTAICFTNTTELQRD